MRHTVHHTARRTLSLVVAMAVLGSAPSAFAQKKATKKAAPAASATTPPPAPPPEPPPPPPPPPQDTAPPQITRDYGTETEANKKPGEEQKDADTVKGAAPTADGFEKMTSQYFYLGLRYRGTVIPKFLINSFVSEGSSIFSNSIGAEIDIRHDGFSLIPALTYSELGTDEMLFRQKGADESIAGNYSLVKSNLKVISASVDMLWSTRLAKNVDLEYGFGFGVGAVFGDLIVNWVERNNSGSLVADSGQHFARCEKEGQGGLNAGCTSKDHQNTDTIRVGGYSEPSWFSGGAKPSILPSINIPIGIRFQPDKHMEARFGLGVSLTGLWFGLSGNYLLGANDHKH